MFIWLKNIYNSEIAYLGLGLLFVTGAVIVKILQWQSRPNLRKKIETKPLPNNIKNDPLVAHIPDSLKDDPLVKKVLVEISENPMAASATALTIGLLLSREYFK